MKYGLIGEKLKHSFSREIHERIGNYSYELREINKEDLPLFLKNRNFEGINVTIPYKKEVIKYLDSASDAVYEIGACNGIVNNKNELYGFNSDFIGIIYMLNHFEIDIRDKKTLENSKVFL